MKKYGILLLASLLGMALTSCGGNSSAPSSSSFENPQTSSSSSSEGSQESSESSSHVHSYEAVVTEPTCTEGGYTTYTCSVCGDSYKDDFTDPLGHQADKDWHYDETNHWHLCSRCGEIIEQAEHEFGEGIVTAPTCTEKGYTTHTCSVCGYSYQDSVTAATGHQSDGTWQSDETSHWHHCSVCGEDYDSAKHLFGDPLVTKESTYDEAGSQSFTCSVCGYVKTESLPLKAPEAIEVASVGYTSNTVIQCQLPAALANLSSDQELTGSNLSHIAAAMNGSSYAPSLVKYWADPHILQIETLGYTPSLGDVLIVSAGSYFEIGGVRYAFKSDLACYFNSVDVASGAWKELTGGTIALSLSYGTASLLMLKSGEAENKIALPASGGNADYNISDHCVLSLLKNGTAYSAPRVWYYVNDGDGVISLDSTAYASDDVITIKKGSVIGQGLSKVYVVAADASFQFDGSNWSAA